MGLPSTTDASGFHDSCISAQCRALERALPFPVTDQPFDIFKMAAYCGERDPAWKKAAGAGEEIILQCMRVTGKAAGFPSTGVEVGVLTFSSLADRNKRYSVDKAGAETAIGHGLSDLGALGADCLATGPCERGLRPGDDKTGTGSVFGVYDSKLGYQTLEWFQDAPTGLCDGDPRCSYVLWAIGFSSVQADFAEADHLYTNFCTTDACMAAWS